MRVTRKELLAGSAALALAGCGSRTAAAAPSKFALDPRWRHFDAFLFAAHPRPVREAIERHRRGLDAGAAAYLRAHEVRLDEAVAVAVARYLGVQPATLAFVDSTTMGLALTYRGLLAPGDEVVTTEHDHYATHESLRLSGAKVRRVRLYEDPATASADGMIAALRRAITDRTKVVALTWVHSGTGVKLPLRKLRAALGHRVTLVVDGVHALGVEPDPVDIHLCDVLVAGTHKWLGGLAAGRLGRADRRRARRRAVHARRLPLVRAPLGAGAGLRLAARARPREGGRAHAPSRDPAEGRAGVDLARDAGDTAFAGGVLRDRLLRRGRPAPRGGRRAPRGAADQGLHHALRRGARTAGNVPPRGRARRRCRP